MKRTFLFLTLTTFFACQSVDQYKAGIEELSTKWDATTTSVNEFTNMLNTEMAGYSDMMGSMNVEETVFASLPAEVQAKVSEAKESYTTAGAGYGQIQAEMNEFLTEWTAKTAEMTALKDGLAQGKLEGDVAAKITELTTMVDEAGTQLASWKTAYESAKASATASHGQFTSVMTVISQQAAPAKVK